jgi:hypothetical protein
LKRTSTLGQFREFKLELSVNTAGSRSSVKSLQGSRPSVAKWDGFDVIRLVGKLRALVQLLRVTLA